MTEHVEGHGLEGQPPDEGRSPLPEPVTSRVPPSAPHTATPHATVAEKSPPDWIESPFVNPQPDVRWREVISILVLVILADITLFRTTGFAGAAAFLAVAPYLLAIASPTATMSVPVVAVGLLIWLVAVRLIWQGSLLAGTAGIFLLVPFTMALSRRRPFALETIGYAFKSWLDASEAIPPYARWAGRQFRRCPWLLSLSWILPLLAVAIFSAIFVAANPDLVDRVSQFWSQLLTRINEWLAGFVITPPEVLFWAVLAWYTIGALRPGDWGRTWPDLFDNVSDELIITSKGNVHRPKESPAITPASNFGPYRNTLIAVSVLFAVYLTYEFKTLWFRKFEKGFHFSGYAHEGAAWLTVALALATAVLSTTFRGPILKDERLPKLKLWAWIWSVQNLLLALAVYNRLWIYIGFNGMTRMRVIGILGITSVVVGFLLVLWKIAHTRGFLWLIRWQLLTVVCACYLYLILPVDWLVYSYNVRRILAGDPAPAVQITEHPVSPEGILTLTPLLQSSDPTIRDGIRSLLSELALHPPENPNGRPGWTSYQLVHDRLKRELTKLPPEILAPGDEAKRANDWMTFKAYAYQWY